MADTAPSVAEYVLTRLSQLGIDRIDSRDGAAHVEVLIPSEESQLPPAATIDRGYKVRTPAAG